MRRLVAVLALGLASGAIAQTQLATSWEPPDEQAVQNARGFRKLEVSGRKLRAAVRKLRGLTWHASLEKAQREAQRVQKPILWFQMLGKLEGYT